MSLTLRSTPLPSVARTCRKRQAGYLHVRLMKSEQSIIRRQVVHALLFVFVLAFAPSVASFLAPSIARFTPPFMLSLVVLLSIANAIFVWRTQKSIKRAQGAVTQPSSDGKLPASFEFPKHDRRNAVIGAYIGLVFSAIMLMLWVHSLL